MARTTTQKEAAAAEIAARLEQGNEREWRDAKSLKRVGERFAALVRCERELADAVHAARTDGHSWAAIAAMLGVSKQTAQHRYGD